MKIGELAQRAQCPVQTIRYYEQLGLLSKALRGENNYRHYSAQHLEQLVFIRNCRHLDMTLEEIQRLLALRDQGSDNCAAINHLIDEHIEHVDSRLRSLKRLKQQLTELRQHCNATAPCAIVEQLQQRQMPNLESSTHNELNGCHAPARSSKGPTA